MILRNPTEPCESLLVPFPLLFTSANLSLITISENLESLSLAGNQLEAFPSAALRPVHELTTLHVDDNKIRQIDERAFEGYGEHIRYLWFQNNQ